MKSVFLTTGFATVAQTAQTEATKIFVARGTFILASPEFTVTGQDLILNYPRLNRYRRKRSKVNASIFDSALSHTRRSDASKKREENSVVALRSLLNVFACGQVSSPRLYRLKIEFSNFMRYEKIFRNIKILLPLFRMLIWGIFWRKFYRQPILKCRKRQTQLFSFNF